MTPLITISALGILCLILELLRLRKALIPVVIIVLLGILAFTFVEFRTGTSFIHPDAYNMVVNTTFSQVFTMLFIILTVLIMALSPATYHDRLEKLSDYVSLKLFLLAGAVAMVSFGNLTMFFMGLEILSIAAYVLAAGNSYSLKGNEAGMKYFFMGALASAILLFGIAFVYGATGSFDINVITQRSIEQGANLPVWFYLGFTMIAVGLFFKSSLVPFHFWAPDVYEGASTLVTTVMSTLVKVTAIASLFKVTEIMAVGVTPTFQTVLIVISILSMTVGNLSALRQVNVKRLLAFSGISHAGFMIMDLLAPEYGNASIFYYASSYALSGIAAFAVLIAVCRGQNNKDISNFNGLVKRNPALAILMCGALLSLAGIPVFAGFFAKFFMFNHMLAKGHLILVIFGVINSIIAIYYYFNIANAMFSKDSPSDKPLTVPIVYIIVPAIAILLNLLLGIFPSVIMELKL